MVNKPWSYPTRVLVIVTGLIGLVWLAIAARPLVQALIVAALLAYLLEPIITLVTRRTRLGHVGAARLVYALFVGLILVIPAGVSTVALTQFDRLEREFIEAVTALGRWLGQPIVIYNVHFQPLAVLQNLEQTAVASLTPLSTGAIAAMLNATTNLFWALTALVSLYYFLVDGPQVKPRLVSLVPADTQPEIGQLLDEIDNAWRIFLRAQLVIFVIFAVLLTSSTYLVIWLYRAGLLPLSPIGLIVLLVVIYTLVQQVDNIWLRPYFFGGRLQLHPGVVFVGLIAGLVLGGLLGVIIAVPFIATAKIVARYTHCKLLGLPPWPHLATATTDDNRTTGVEKQPEDNGAEPPGEVVIARQRPRQSKAQPFPGKNP